MNARAEGFIAAVKWEELEGAYGPATEVPGFLRKMAVAKGKKLFHLSGEFCSHVLHQGTIYSGSPPAVHALLDMLPGRTGEERLNFYVMLAGFAEAAQQSFADGKAMSCGAGGDTVDAAAIRDEILDAYEKFMPDLEDGDPRVRALAADLLTAFPRPEPAAVELVREQYFREPDKEARGMMFTGLERVRASMSGWPEFLGMALEGERDAAARYPLLCSQMRDVPAERTLAKMDDLISAFAAKASERRYCLVRDEPFFECVRMFGPEHEREAVLKALQQVTQSDPLRVLAERLLRLVFDDRRTGWGMVSYRQLDLNGEPAAHIGVAQQALRMMALLILIKIFPGYFRGRTERLAKAEDAGIWRMTYSPLHGGAPRVPEKLTGPQIAVLSAIASNARLWEFRTNLWELFGLPCTQGGMRQFVDGGL